MSEENQHYYNVSAGLRTKIEPLNSDGSIPIEALTRSILVQVATSLPDEAALLTQEIEQLENLEAGAHAAGIPLINFVVSSKTRLEPAVLLFLARWSITDALRDAEGEWRGLNALIMLGIAKTGMNAAGENAIRVVDVAKQILDLRRSDLAELKKAMSDAAAATHEVAIAAAKISWTKLALNLATAAVNLLMDAPEETLKPILATALQYAISSNDSELVLFLEARQARAVVDAAIQNPQRRLEAFDQMEIAIRSCPVNLRNTPLGEYIAQSLDQLDALRPLKALWSVARRDPVTQTAAFATLPFEAMDMLARVEFPLEELRTIVSDNAKPLIHLINTRRDELSGPMGWESASVSWRDRSLTYPAFQRAVPNGRWMDLEPAPTVDEFLMLLLHEVTHAYCLFGPLGVADLAIRAVLEYHLEWCAATKFLTVEEARRWHEDGRRDLDDLRPEVLALFAGRIASISQKRQALWDVWTPWLEGIAVFAETALDSPDEPEVLGLHMAALLNLRDRRGEDKPENEQFFLNEIDNLQTRYQQALDRQTVPHLWNYLATNGYRQRYLAGYFAVRAVVSSWRKTLGQKISGASAARLLLHATQYGGYEMIPDLSSAAEGFTRATADSMLNWIDSLAKAPAADLETAIASFTQDDTNPGGFFWSKGRLVKSQSEEESSLRAGEWISRLCKQLIDSPTLNAAMVAQIPKDNQSAIAHMETLVQTQAMSDSKHIETFTEVLFSDSFLLSIGEAECLFYLTPKTNSDEVEYVMVCLPVRRATRSAEMLFNWVALSLEPANASQLRKLVEVHGPCRMTVRRVIDLANRGINGGQHYFILSFYEWVYCWRAGIFFGAPVSDKELLPRLEARAHPSVLVTSFHFHFGDDQRFITRARAELNKQPSTDAAPLLYELKDGKRVRIAFDLWARNVRDECDRVLQEASNSQSTIEEISKQLFYWITGDAQIAQKLTDRGLSSVLESGFSNLDQFVQFLGETGRTQHSNVRLEDLRAASDIIRALTSTSNAGQDARCPSGPVGPLHT
jgi:hypothetical protein